MSLSISSCARECWRAASLEGQSVSGPWRAHLRLSFQRAGQLTRLAERRHEGPLLVQRVFQPEAADGGPCHVYVLHPPGGVVSGDQLELRVGVQPSARVLITTAAAGKFYRSSQPAVSSRVLQSFWIEDGTLEWLPLENIFYPDTSCELATCLHLSGSACVIGWEIACLGLPANGLGLGTGELRQGLEIWREGQPLLIERFRLDEQSIAAPWGLAGYRAVGTCVAYPAGAQLLERARAAAAPLADPTLELACTLVDGVLCCRARARRADRIRHAFIGLWHTLRPALLGRFPRPPRIWAT